MSLRKQGSRVRAVMILTLLILAAVPAWAQGEVTVTGAGATGVIVYGETVTGDITVSDASQVEAISFVGHNGANRVQGDFDVWYFDARQGDNAVITLTATSGDLIPTLLVVGEVDETERIPSVSAWDGNPDGDLTAGVCLRGVYRDRRYAILAFRQNGTAQTGDYRLTLEKVSADELGGGSETAVCRVGTFVVTQGDNRVNIRSNPGLAFSVKAQMQPGALYTLFSPGGDWTHILFWSGDRVDDGYVSTPLIRLTGQAGLSPIPKPSAGASAG